MTRILGATRITFETGDRGLVIGSSTKRTSRRSASRVMMLVRALKNGVPAEVKRTFTTGTYSMGIGLRQFYWRAACGADTNVFESNQKQLPCMPGPECAGFPVEFA